MLIDERRKEDYYFPGFIWSLVGIGVFLPSGIVISILQSYYGVEEVLNQPYLSITGPIIILVLILTIIGPLPYQIYKRRNSQKYFRSIQNQRFTGSQFKNSDGVISKREIEIKSEISGKLSLSPFYCQLCCIKHPAGTPRLQCDQCGRNLCVDSYSEMVSVGRTSCPMCDGTLG